MVSISVPSRRIEPVPDSTTIASCPGSPCLTKIDPSWTLVSVVTPARNCNSFLDKSANSGIASNAFVYSSRRSRVTGSSRLVAGGYRKLDRPDVENSERILTEHLAYVGFIPTPLK